MAETATNLVYASRSSRNVLDVVVPEAAVPPPLVVFIHGGAFRVGDKTDCAVERQALVDAGFAVASLNYRYSTEAIWPAQLDDLRDAFAYLRSKGTQLGYDATRVASFGPSAGGHLSACCGITFAANSTTCLKASIVWFPPVDFPTMDADMEASAVPRATGRNDVAGSPESTLVGATVADDPERARSANPVTLLSQLPPRTSLPDFLIMHGAKDPYIAANQSRRLHTAIAGFGTAPRLALDVLAEGTHGGGDFEKPETMARVVAFLGQSFRG